jgi:formylglycine-generating enzyme required for sulfatase activity
VTRLGTAIALLLAFAISAKPTWTEHRRALLIDASGAHAATVDTLAKTLRDNGFVVSTRSQDYEPWLRSIPAQGVSLTYYCGRLNTLHANDKKTVAYGFQIPDYTPLPMAQNPKAGRNPPSPEEPGLSTLRLGQRLSRNTARQNLVVIDCLGFDDRIKSGEEPARMANNALRAISGGNRVFSALSAKSGTPAAEALITLLAGDAKIATVFKGDFHTSFPRDQNFALMHTHADVCSPPDSPIPGRFAGEQWVGPNGVAFVWCPAGSFTMGDAQFDDAQPVAVTLSKGYWIGKYELTRGEAGLMTGSEGSFFSGREKYQPAQLGNIDQTIEALYAWTEYQKSVGLGIVGWSYDFPSEAEWEYACRAGSSAAFPAVEKNMGRFANFADLSLYRDRAVVHYIYASQAADDGYAAKLAHIGQFEPNSWGLHDMHGNVAELVGDFYGDSLKGGTDPFDQHLETSRSRRRLVIRGGAWCSPLDYLHVAHRGVFPGTRLPYAGTRLVLRQGEPVFRSSKTIQLEIKAREAQK